MINALATICDNNHHEKIDVGADMFYSDHFVDENKYEQTYNLWIKKYFVGIARNRSEVYVT